MPYEIGLTEVGLTDLALLAVPVEYPRGKENFQPYSVYKNLGNKKRKGFGQPITRWVFPVISQEERDQLKTFFPTESDTVFITTRLPDDTYISYETTGNWPQKEPVFGGGYFQNLVIEFEFMASL